MKWHIETIIVYQDWRREVWQKYTEVSVEHTDSKIRFMQAGKFLSDYKALHPRKL